MPWGDDNDTELTLKNLTPLEGFDSQLLAQTLQLDGLFGQELNFDQLDEATTALLYDEMTFGMCDLSLSLLALTLWYIDPSPVATPIPSPKHDEEILEEVVPDNAELSLPPIATPPPPAVVDHVEDSSTDDDSDDNDEDESDNSDEEDGPVSVMTTSYMYLPKRQVEETLLTKITEQLLPDKLPGILSIVSSHDDQEGEVEIDLSCLVREQLVRVMLYVDDCILEQQGGPKVKLSKYLLKESKPAKKQPLVDDDDDDDEEDTLGTTVGDKRRRKRRSHSSTEEGPISMAALTKKSRKQDTSPSKPTPKRRRRAKKDQQEGSVNTKLPSTPSTRPKRRSALHKRRMLEEMLLGLSDQEDDDEDMMDQQVMVTYGEEQMDFGVVDNQTIVHQPQAMSPVSIDPLSSGSIATHDGDNDDDDQDEEIDIM